MAPEARFLGLTQDVERGDALLGVLHERGADEVLGRLGDVAPLGGLELELVVLDGVEDGIVAVAPEGGESTQHDVQHNACTHISQDRAATVRRCIHMPNAIRIGTAFIRQVFIQ